MPSGSHLAVDTLPSGESELPPANEAVNPAFGYDAPHPSVRGTSTLLNNALLSAHYKPLRHPMPPGPSLAGLRLVIADHVMGLPVLRALSLVYMPSPIPRRGGWDHRSALASPTLSAFPIRGAGRPAHRPFRGLLGVHSRYGLYTRHVTEFRDALVTEGFNCFVTSTVAPVASGWSISPGGTLTHWKAPPSTAHPGSRRSRLEKGTFRAEGSSGHDVPFISGCSG